MLCVAVTLLLLILSIDAHSWVRCADYKAQILGGDYSEEQCKGWIRGWKFDGIAFGQDRGVNHQVAVGGGQNLCQRPFNGDFKNDPMLAKYNSGSTVRVVWPAKNHANYECSNNIPDNSMKLYFNPNPNPSADLPNNQRSMTENGWKLVKDWHDGCTKGTDGCGFQNCPGFCRNTDKATCYGDFVVPNVAESGYYTFAWYWIFNPGSPYVSCWEAYIDKEVVVATNDGSASGSSTGGSGTGNFVASSGDPNAGRTVNGYLTQIPFCTRGKAYDSAATKGALEVVFEDHSKSDEISIINVDASQSSANFTAQFDHRDSKTAQIAQVGMQEFCDKYRKLHPSLTMCKVCGDVQIYAVLSPTDSQASTIRLTHASILIVMSTILSFLL